MARETSFDIWGQLMRAILVQQKVTQALQGEKNLPSTMIETKKMEMLETTYSTMIVIVF